MTSHRQKQEEEFIIKQFLAAAKIEWIEIRVREEPDAMVTLQSAQEAGIELVEYHQADMTDKSNNQRRFEAAWAHLNNCIAARVKEHPQVSTLDHILGRVRFEKNVLPPKKQVCDFAAELVGIMDSHAAEVIKQGSVSLEDFTNYPLCKHYVQHITLRDSKIPGIGWWTCSAVQSGAVGLNQSELERVITDKCTKAPVYRANIGNRPLWLLVHAGYTAAMFAPPFSQLSGYAARNQGFLSGAGFDSIWFYPTFDDLSQNDEPIPMRAIRLL